MKILTQWLRSYLPALPVDDLQLAEDLTLRGIAVEGVHALGGSGRGDALGHLFEMDITTNRVDAMNHYGIAREAATMYGLPLHGLETRVTADDSAGGFAVEIAPEARELCGRFTARVLRGVKIAASGGRVAEYFGLLGIKQISNAVDASNFTLHGMGHPTHAFDLDRIEGGIVVRLARPGETLRLLDGTELTLAPDDLVIADHVKALSLAGVMGGWDSRVTSETRNIVVESAWFDPVTIRRSSRRHGLHTDASHRFERGADFSAAPVANDLVSGLILESGGRAEGGLVDVLVPEVAARTANRPPVGLSAEAVPALLGRTLEDRAGRSALTPELIEGYLTSLGCRLCPDPGASSQSGPRAAGTGGKSAGATYLVTLPSWRLDLEREVDLIEEVARVFGYNRFANTLPAPLPVRAHPLAGAERAVRGRMLALGFSEALSTSFGSEADAGVFAAGARPVALENPLSEEARLLRPSLVPGMVAMLAQNLNRDTRDVRLFEMGAVFSGVADDVVETESLVVGITGELPGSPIYSAEDAGFYWLKGAVEAVVSLFAAPAAEFGPETPVWVEPERGATVRLEGRVIAEFGELAAAERDARKLRQPVWLASIDLAALYRLPLRNATARELSRFQAVERDFSFVFPDDTAWAAVRDAISGIGIAELTRMAPAEIFRDTKGAAVPGGHYALLVRCTFQSSDRTLREDELSAWSGAIVQALTQAGGTHRG
jgi:phenylalanyl-tRNA synthetase beta chain